MDNLPELRDIHLPDDEISFFPLAYGWWGILLLVVAFVVFFKLCLWARKTSAAIYARKLLKELKDDRSMSSVVKISEILRRICVRRYPQAVSLYGDNWIKFLNSRSKKQLDGDIAELLKNAPFMNINSVSVDIKKYQELWNFCYEWIGENL